jgi:hypothetical protein
MSLHAIPQDAQSVPKVLVTFVHAEESMPSFLLL